MKHWRKYIAEGLGTMLLVLCGCGVAAVFGTGSAGVLATALAFGFALLVLSYAIGHVSGCHLNPAVTFAMLITGKISVIRALWYMFAQVVGATVGAALVALFCGNFAFLGGNAVQPFLEDAFGGVSLIVALIVETVLTFAFIFVIIGVNRRTDNKTVTGVVAGLAMTLVYLLGLPLTGASANPARSLGPALMQMIGGNFAAISQIWIFLIGPFLGAALAAAAYNIIDPQMQSYDI